MLERPGRLRRRTIDDPSSSTGPGDAAVEVRVVGLCGTDHSIFTGAIPVDHPRVLGHEVVGDVVDGPFPRGTRVLVDPNLACGACARCLEGRQNVCDDARLLGRDRDGGLAERITVPSGQLHPLPDEVPDDVAPTIQVLSTCLHGQRLAPPRAGAAVVVVGLGVTGLMHVRLAAAVGAAPIVGITRSARKREAALAAGATATIDATGGDVVARATALTDGGADLVIECAGTVATLGLAVVLAHRGGRVLAYGTITEPAGTFPFYELYHREVRLVGARAATRDDVASALDAVAHGGIDLAGIVTHRTDLDGVEDAMHAFGAPDRLKTVVMV